MKNNFKVGVAIATFNNVGVLRECLQALSKTADVNLYIVVVDDGSSDGTWEMLRDGFPEVTIIRGNGMLWWTGGTNLAIKACLQANCDFVLLLNPDVIVGVDTITQLISFTTVYPETILAPVVVNHDAPDIVWWAGSQWQQLFQRIPFIWTSRYLYKAGISVDTLPSQPYRTSEAHGRSVLIPSDIFRRIGLYDAKRLPHYGADTDFSFRARHAGFNTLIFPQVHVRLHVDNTGMKSSDTLQDSLRGYWNYLTQRKNGEALRVWWQITQRHLPWYSAILSYLFILGWNSYRYWSHIFRQLLGVEK